MTADQRHEVITLLEDAAAARRPLIIELRDGRNFCDGVCAVRRACGEDVVRAAPSSSHDHEDIECILEEVADGSGVWAAL